VVRRVVVATKFGSGRIFQLGELPWRAETEKEQPSVRDAGKVLMVIGVGHMMAVLK
jgi:hypothetical protein